ncbi:hypothetical protein SWPG_00185 [Synechococcus phage S-CBM2]|nr:hypothetical protein SWPG_00185 [Synechococcus phage S-CBM2]
MTSFTDYLYDLPNKQQTMQNVLKYTEMLIESLKQNYVQYAIRGHQRHVVDADTHCYHKEQIVKLRNGDCPIDYMIETGKRYHKVVFVDAGGSRSVHCFVDKNTGDVYKSASWKSPAKGVRYSLMDDNSREQCLETCDWSGGYLYA